MLVVGIVSHMRNWGDLEEEQIGGIVYAGLAGRNLEQVDVVDKMVGLLLVVQQIVVFGTNLSIESPRRSQVQVGEHQEEGIGMAKRHNHPSRVVVDGRVVYHPHCSKNVSALGSMIHWAENAHFGHNPLLRYRNLH